MAGDAEAALAGYRRSEQLMRELDAGDDVTHQQIRAGLAQAATGDVEGARLALKGALATSEASGSWHGEVFSLLALGELNRHWGDRTAAHALLSRALDRYHERGGARPPQLAAMTHAALCFLALDGDDHARPRDELAMAVRHGLAFRDGPVLARVAVAAAAVAERDGDAEQAARLLGAGWALRGGDDLSSPDDARLRADLRDRLGAAAFEAAHESGRLLPRDAAIDLVREQGGTAPA